MSFADKLPKWVERILELSNTRFGTGTSKSNYSKCQVLSILGIGKISPVFGNKANRRRMWKRQNMKRQRKSENFPRRLERPSSNFLLWFMMGGDVGLVSLSILIDTETWDVDHKKRHAMMGPYLYLPPCRNPWVDTPIKWWFQALFGRRQNN